MATVLKCCKCDHVLPTDRNLSDDYQSTVHGRNVYIFNGGKYYRPVGQDYECRQCFVKEEKDRRLRKEQR